MRSMILSQCRDLRIGVTRENLGALTTILTKVCGLLFGATLYINRPTINTVNLSPESINNW